MSKRILLIDNDPDCLDAIRDLIICNSFEVLAKDGNQDIFTLIDGFQPDLLLIDYLLDGTNGGEICINVKQDEKRNGLPVIIMSAHPKVINSLGCYKCDAFIAKPFDQDDLTEKIHELTSIIKMSYLSVTRTNHNEGINKIVLAGYVETNPRWHAGTEGRWLHFTLVTREIIHSLKGTFEHEELHHIRIADKYLALKDLEPKKDDYLFVQGKIRTSIYIDNDDIKRYRTAIVVNNMERFDAPGKINTD